MVAMSLTTPGGPKPSQTNSPSTPQIGGEALLEVRNLTKHFAVPGGLMTRRSSGHDVVHAVDGVSFTIQAGEVLGLVGESGCGKSTLGRLILRLLEATGGSVRFEGQEVLTLRRRDLFALRRRMQIIFQDPYASLNPRMKIGKIVEEPLVIHRIGPPGQAGRIARRERVVELLQQVGLDEMLAQYDRFVGQEAARGAQVTPPTMTIRAQATLPFRDRTIILAHIGKGHTDGDIVVWLPEDRVLFTGDLVYNRRLPWLGGGSVLEWLTTLKRLKEFPFTWVVPGHGPVGTRQTVERFERYLTSLRKEVIEAFLHEEPLDTLKQRLRLPSYKEDIKYEEWLPLNIEQVYRQMEQEKFSN